MKQATKKFSFEALNETDRLAYVQDMMRQISLQTDPQRLVQTYMRYIRQIVPSD